MSSKGTSTTASRVVGMGGMVHCTSPNGDGEQEDALSTR